MGLTKRMIQKCHEINYDALPTDVVDCVKYLLLDFIGVAGRGALSDSSSPVHCFVPAVIEIITETVALFSRIETQVAIVGEEQWSAHLRADPLAIAIVGILVGVLSRTGPAIVITRSRDRMRRRRNRQ